MASAIRIITINDGEEAMIRVNSNRPITLEFPGNLVSVYEENGLVFQRIEKQDTNTQEHYEPGGDMEATQYLETQTQIEEYDEEVVNMLPVFDDFPGDEAETPLNGITLDMDVVFNMRRMSICLSRVEMDDISELQEELFS
jgi:hypothetical protein